MLKINSLKKMLLSCLVVMIILHSSFVPAIYGSDNRNYMYDEMGVPVESSAGHYVSNVAYDTNLGAGYLNAPEDMFVLDDKIYILDSGNSRIVIFDKNYNLVRIIDSITLEGAPESLLSPKGIFVTSSEDIFIADTGNSRVLVIDQQGEVKRIYTKPGSEIYPQTEDFKPLKVVVDASGVLYVLCNGIYNGAVIFADDGEFLGFYGSNRVEVSLELLVEKFWKKIFYKEENQSNFKSYIPVEYSSFDIDNEGFIYTCSAIATSNTNSVRKLNSTGFNIFEGLVENSFQEGFGDLNPGIINGVLKQTKFIDICINESGYVYALDFERGRIFNYSQDTNLLFIFGGHSQNIGNFKEPVAIDDLGDKILVLDKSNCSITEFSLTDFGKSVHTANDLYKQGKHIEAIEPWEKVLTNDSNYALANIGIGKAYYELGDFGSAIRYFRLARYVPGYDIAFKELRTERIRSNFYLISAILLFIYLLFVLSRKFRLKNRFASYIASKGENALPAKVMDSIKKVTLPAFHPIEGYQTLAQSADYRIKPGIFVLLVLFLALLSKTQYTGFIFNSHYSPESLNIALIAFQSFGLVFLFAVVNWALCTLFDGKGTVRQIFVVTSYAVVPLLAGIFAALIMSNIMTLEESVFITYLTVVSQIYAAFLLVKGIESVHQYSFPKSILSIIMTFVGMVLLTLLVILFFSLLQQIYGFVVTVLREYNLRYT